jgi:peptide/nickel transport system permease protein
VVTLSIVLRHPRAVVGLVIVGIFLLMAAFGPLLAPYPPEQIGSGPSEAGPSLQHWLGTTQLGQDIFSQLLAGARPSLLMAITAGLIINVIALLVGLTGGYLRGWPDDILSTLTNVFLILPALPLLIVIGTYAAAFHIRGVATITLVVALVGWPWGARAFRGQMLSLRAKDFVMAARVSGESTPRIIFAELLPNMISLVAANFIFATSAALIAEVGLEYIGLGDSSQATWGTMLFWAQNGAALLTGAWYWFVPPGLCIGLFSVGLVMLNYAVDEVANPRLRTQQAHEARHDATT